MIPGDGGSLEDCNPKGMPLSGAGERRIFLVLKMPSFPPSAAFLKPDQAHTSIESFD
jgi:hypothetical protein